jgi:ubiquinone/menaquinone biosynthesis C-methylase UbiE
MTAPANPKDAQLQSWTAVAPGWRKHDQRLVESSAPATERLLDRAGVKAGMRVLDVASGTGEPALPAAKRVGPSGSVLGTDLVEPMLAFAREKAAAQGLRNVEFRCVDGEVLELPAGSFDAATIRWGIMFMPDAVACLRQVHAALKPGGRVAVACWASPEQNPWAAVPARVLMKAAEAAPPPPGAPGIFAYADPKKLEATLADAGFKSISVEPVELTMADFDSASDYWTFTRDLAGPIAMLFAKLSPEKQASATSEILSEIDRLSPGGRTILRGVTWVASGEK